PAKMTFLILLLLFAIKRPLKEIFFTDDTDSSLSQLAATATHPFNQLTETYQKDKDCFAAADSLKKVFKAKARLASFFKEDSLRPRSGRSSFIAFKTGTK